MKTSKFTDEQIAMALRQAEAGAPVGRSAADWASASRASTAGRSALGQGVSELRELRQLRDENRKLKGLVADLTLDKTILPEGSQKQMVGPAARSCTGRERRTRCPSAGPAAP